MLNVLCYKAKTKCKQRETVSLTLFKVQKYSLIKTLYVYTVLKNITASFTYQEWHLDILAAVSCVLNLHTNREVKIQIWCFL